MKIKHFPLLCPWLPKNIAALTLFPFILYKKKTYTTDDILVNHERIHLQQQVELLILPFYLWYAVEFLVHFAYLKNKGKAYRAISFEREAYANEENLEYLKTRRFYAFVR
ncbi:MULTISPECIES: hypothetical protein [unclassified Myroides]|uniref:hypothetical protein n=1 Tax=unclassified Myroides TaxID=2642485 RepID=UPI003D2F6AAC